MTSWGAIACIFGPGEPRREQPETGGRWRLECRAPHVPVLSRGPVLVGRTGMLEGLYTEPAEPAMAGRARKLCSGEKAYGRWRRKGDPPVTGFWALRAERSNPWNNLRFFNVRASKRPGRGWPSSSWMRAWTSLIRRGSSLSS